MNVAVNVAANASNFVPFPDMVKALFKATPGLTPAHRPTDYIADSLMHAAVGIAGEASELILACTSHDEENVLEELGDARFYMQAVWNYFGWEMASFSAAKVPASYPQDDLLCFSIAAGELLDVVKKVWVYNKPLDVLAIDNAMNILVHLYNALLVKYNLQDQQVQHANQSKLGKRYPQGVYTDADAQARADKVA